MIASLFIAALGFVLIFVAFRDNVIPGLIVLGSNVSTDNSSKLASGKAWPSVHHHCAYWGSSSRMAQIMGVASNEAREAVASSLFWIMTRVSGVSHTPRMMCVRSGDRDRS